MKLRDADDPMRLGAVVPPADLAGAPPLPADSVSPVLRGPVGRALIWLALPVLAEQFLNTLVGLTDLWLATYVSGSATVAIGVTGFFNWLVNLLFSLVGIGATAIVARSVGGRQYDDANRAANQALGLAILMGLAAAGVVNAFATQVPVLFGLRNEAVPAAILYLRIDAVGHLLGCALFVGNACLRGAGDTRTPMRVMVIVNLTNMAVSAALVFGVAGLIPPCGVAGIAWGTAAARLLGGSLVLLTLIRARGTSWSREGGSALLRLRLSRMPPHGAMLRRLLRIGVPAGMDGLALWLGQLVFLRIINGLAEGREQADIFAAHVTGVRIESLTYLPAYAWASAAATIVGQSLGARDEKRAVRGGHLAAVQAGVQAGLLSLAYFFFAPQLYGFFSAEPQVVAVGVPAFRLLAFFQIPLAAEIVFKNALRGAGDTRYPLIFTLIGMFAVRMPLGYLGGHVLNGGLMGAWIGMCGDILLRSILSTARFLQGGWKRICV